MDVLFSLLTLAFLTLAIVGSFIPRAVLPKALHPTRFKAFSIFFMLFVIAGSISGVRKEAAEAERMKDPAYAAAKKREAEEAARDTPWARAAARREAEREERERKAAARREAEKEASERLAAERRNVEKEEKVTKVPEKAQAKIPYTVASSYAKAGSTWKIVVVKGPLTDSDLIALASDLHRMYTEVSFQIFDDASQVKAYENWTKNYPNPAHPYPEKWVRQHHIGMINKMLAPGGATWQLLGGAAHPTSPESKIVDLD